MSKLIELIKALCPNGTDYIKIEQLCNITRGRVISKEYIRDNVGVYPVYSSQTENDGILGRITTYDFEGEYLSWTTDGANAGTVFYRRGKFSVTNVCGLLNVKDNCQVIPKFLYYALNRIAPDFVNKGMGNPKLMSNVMARIKVPVPPLPVQEEIVRILDKFIELTAELTAELTTELTARKHQYDFYRNKLLFSSNAPLVTLREVVKHSCAGATPKKGMSAYYEGGTIPWIRTQDVRFNDIHEVDSYITEAAVEQTGVKWIPENCVIVAISGASAGRCAINKIKATTNQHCLNLEIDETKALYQYVYYCVSGCYYELLSLKQGARGDLNSSLILGISIPLPNIDEQKKIVKIIDEFNKLAKDISSGLPAEIEARQKQYEYYRDKLLTFKPLTA